MTQALYLHGGPGFNSRAEHAILGPVLEKAGLVTTFWNEPSSLRPSGAPFQITRAYAGWLASAEHELIERTREGGPIVLLAHSFAVHAALQFAQRHRERLLGVVALAPSMDLHAVYGSVLALAQSDFEGANDARAIELGQLRAETRTLLDAPMATGLGVAAGDPGLFGHYWADGQARAIAQETTAAPDAQFDGASFFAVLSDFAASRSGQASGAERVDVPCFAVFGEEDPIAPRAHHEPLLAARVRHLVGKSYSPASHNVHMERPDEWVADCVQWLRTVTGSAGA